jgi:hypothetical protein
MGQQTRLIMNCPDCGELLEQDAQFCPKCFARIEPPGFWKRLFSLLTSRKKLRQPFIRIQKTISIKTTDKDGQQHEYRSLEQLPPEIRAEIEKAESEALKNAVKSSSSDGLTTTISTHKTISLFKVKDASGNERVYHSLEELPPEIRTAIEQARKETPQ